MTLMWILLGGSTVYAAYVWTTGHLDESRRIRHNERAMSAARKLTAETNRCSPDDRAWLTAHWRAAIAPDPDMTNPDLRRPL